METYQIYLLVHIVSIFLGIIIANKYYTDDTTSLTISSIVFWPITFLVLLSTQIGKWNIKLSNLHILSNPFKKTPMYGFYRWGDLVYVGGDLHIVVGESDLDHALKVVKKWTDKVLICHTKYITPSMKTQHLKEELLILRESEELRVQANNLKDRSDKLTSKINKFRNVLD